MATRRITATLWMPFAVALIASATGCEARPSALGKASQQCSTCHGLPPAKDAHETHVEFLTAQAKALGVPSPDPRDTCAQCHRDVVDVNQPGHILEADGRPVVTPAEVRFDDASALATRAEPGVTRTAGPTYDRAARTCSNVYCHGTALKGATPDLIAAPAWDAPAGTVSCGKCHGLPPANHPSGLTLANCAQCHGDAIDASGTPNPAKHVNGTVDVRQVIATSCSACHGDRTVTTQPGDPRSAPPTDAEGRAASAAVGAHQNHVVAGVVGRAVACSECHVVPTSFFAPGHFDNDVTVTFGPLASTGGATPSYDRASQTCSNVYCHGTFLKSSANPVVPPKWGEADAAAACGRCHDLPPPAPAHPTVDVVAQGCSARDPARPTLACHPGPTATTPGFSYDPATKQGTVDPAVHIDGNACLTDANGVRIPAFCGP